MVTIAGSITRSPRQGANSGAFTVPLVEDTHESDWFAAFLDQENIRQDLEWLRNLAISFTPWPELAWEKMMETRSSNAEPTVVDPTIPVGDGSGAQSVLGNLDGQTESGRGTDDNPVDWLRRAQNYLLLSPAGQQLVTLISSLSCIYTETNLLDLLENILREVSAPRESGIVQPKRNRRSLRAILQLCTSGLVIFVVQDLLLVALDVSYKTLARPSNSPDAPSPHASEPGKSEFRMQPHRRATARDCADLLLSYAEVGAGGTVLVRNLFGLEPLCAVLLALYPSMIAVRHERSQSVKEDQKQPHPGRTLVFEYNSSEQNRVVRLSNRGRSMKGSNRIRDIVPLFSWLSAQALSATLGVNDAVLEILLRRTSMLEPIVASNDSVLKSHQVLPLSPPQLVLQKLGRQSSTYGRPKRSFQKDLSRVSGTKDLVFLMTAVNTVCDRSQVRAFIVSLLMRPTGYEVDSALMDDATVALCRDDIISDSFRGSMKREVHWFASAFAKLYEQRKDDHAVVSEYSDTNKWVVLMFAIAVFQKQDNFRAPILVWNMFEFAEFCAVLVNLYPVRITVGNLAPRALEKDLQDSKNVIDIIFGIDERRSPGIGLNYVSEDSMMPLINVWQNSMAVEQPKEPLPRGKGSERSSRTARFGGRFMEQLSWPELIPLDMVKSIIMPVYRLAARASSPLTGKEAYTISLLSRAVEQLPPLPQYLAATKSITLSDASRLRILADSVPRTSFIPGNDGESPKQYPVLVVFCTGLSIVMDSPRCRGVLWEVLNQTGVPEGTRWTRVLRMCNSKTLKEIAREPVEASLERLRIAFARRLEGTRGAASFPPVRLHHALPSDYAHLWRECQRLSDLTGRQRRTIRVVNGRDFEEFCAVLATLYPVTIQISGEAVEPRNGEQMRQNRIWVAFEYDRERAYEISEFTADVRTRKAGVLEASSRVQLRSLSLDTVLYLAAEAMLAPGCDILGRAKSAHTKRGCSVGLDTIAFETVERLVKSLAHVFQFAAATVERQGTLSLLSWQDLTLDQLRVVHSVSQHQMDSMPPAMAYGYRNLIRLLIYLAFLAAIVSPRDEDDYWNLALMVDEENFFSKVPQLATVRDMLLDIPTTVCGYIPHDGDYGFKANIASVVRNSFDYWLYPSFLCDQDISTVPWPPIKLIPHPFSFPAARSAEWSKSALTLLRNVDRLVPSETAPVSLQSHETVLSPSTLLPHDSFGQSERIEVLRLSANAWGDLFCTVEEGEPIILSLIMIGLLETTMVYSYAATTEVHSDGWTTVTPYHVYDDATENPGHQRFVVASYRNNVARRLAIYGATKAKKRSMMFLGAHFQQGLKFAEDHDYEVVIL